MPLLHGFYLAFDQLKADNLYLTGKLPEVEIYVVGKSEVRHCRIVKLFGYVVGHCYNLRFCSVETSKDRKADRRREKEHSTGADDRGRAKKS